MKIDDFMTQASDYNSDSDTITGFFNLDEEKMTANAISVFETASKADMKSDILLAIDAITDNKIEAIVLCFVVTEKMMNLSHNDESEDVDITATKIAMALSICHKKDLIDDDTAESIMNVFAKVFSSM